MSKIRIDESERYPDYSAGAKYGYEVEATDEQIARWVAAAEAYRVAQDEMGELYDAAEAVELEQRKTEKAERDAQEKAERESQRREREAASRRRAKATERMLGTVYDAEGTPVGEVTQNKTGLHVAPVIDA